MSDTAKRNGVNLKSSCVILRGREMVMLLAGMLTLMSCARDPAGRYPAPPQMSIMAWSFDGQAARTINTEHYAIHTTIENNEFLDTLAVVMEGAYQHYQQLAPAPPPAGGRLMECYVFARRSQWERFTREHTGEDASIYLKINRGGYTVRDWFVAYDIGAEGTYAVVAHEGWHQYVARHFRSRLPPFLEEGIATMYENIAWGARGPRWNVASNPNRADKLRSAIEHGHLWGLDTLCTMHAGDVVSLSGERIETFYAQNWAFAHFLMNAEGGKYRPMFKTMMSELASGAADQHTGRRRSPPETWDPRTVQPLLEHYLGMNMKEIDRVYQAYIRHLAYGPGSMQRVVD